ncbi:membrane-bound PQQ-dependent dehydrogenase, glucose/quinate/shikimate family [Pseudacidovorax intermedius]|uniref:Glucose dehydrogenase n=1 Tax=Pseudacidovorax intermedius TaxID=433924 RepID=A0A147GNR3_9BURK|nr:membrane-bound PQQ-dependent dehydrogenase, glucose/quinate/shikimate family [Pseudacidovorax intermedius]KTT15426.1 glucose dehydrogenase [Pseudacidovorax intermedius]
MARVTGVLFILLGLALAAAGGWLLSLGGSVYYLLAGLAMAATGALLRRRSVAALWLYALLLLVSAAWAVWEVGVDWWPLAARLDVLFVLGLWLVLPWMRRALEQPRVGTRPSLTRTRTPGMAPARGALGFVLAASAVLAVASWFRNPQAIDGNLQARAAATPAATDAPAPTIPPGEWHAYGRTGEGQRYSPLSQIAATNVDGLKLAWEYQTGDVRGKPGDPEETTFEVTPLKIGNRLFLCTPHQSVIALDATTGKQVWRFDPQIAGDLALQHLTCRGLSYQAAAVPAASGNAATAQPQPAVAAAAPEPARPGAGTAANPAPTTAPTDAGSTQDNANASALPLPVAARQGPTAPSCPAKLFMPTADGRVIALNPDNGAVCADFGRGSGQIDLWRHMPNVRPGAYYSTSPVVVTARLVIVGGTVLDNASTKEQSGVIRAFDIRTGDLVWNWDSGNPEDTAPLPPGRTYTPNSPNSWSISSVDETLGLVYIPMGNQPPDQWGGRRSEAVERYSSSVVALDLATGRVRWHFQTVHHDLWDYDVPAQPTLVDLDMGGQRVPALVQPTKQGELFVLDRRTGQPLLPVTEVPAPQGAAEGDHTAPTQPRSALSFEPAPLTERSMWGATMFDQLACRIAFHRLRYEGRFTPPSEQGSIIYPGNFGVFNWGGIAVDPQHGWAFTTPTYLAFVSKLVRRHDETTLMVQEGGPPKGSLPALNENFGAPFAASMKPFMSPVGLPCQAPPWGYVAGVDLRSGQVVWKHRNGTVRDLSPLPLPFKMGVPGIGGPMMTAGGVAFYSGALDNYVRAYDVRTGRQLWQDRLPAGGQATPMTYTGEDGRQYVLVVAGGHGSTGTKPGDSVRAYALPAVPQ